MCQDRYQSRSQREHDEANIEKAPTDTDAYWLVFPAPQQWMHTFMQVSLTSGMPLAGFGETDSLTSLEQSQMHPPPTKPGHLVPGRPQTLKQHNVPRPCHSKFPILSPQRKVIKTRYLLEAHTSTHSSGYFPPVKIHKEKKGNNYMKNNVLWHHFSMLPFLLLQIFVFEDLFLHEKWDLLCMQTLQTITSTWLHYFKLNKIGLL